jgi:hypothetical protein
MIEKRTALDIERRAADAFDGAIDRDQLDGRTRAVAGAVARDQSPVRLRD